MTAHAIRSRFSLSGPLLPALLVIAIFLSALTVVRVKHENRDWVAQLEQLRKDHERLQSEWAQLQIEEATLGHHSRVEKLAREQLGMVEPRDYVVIGAQR